MKLDILPAVAIDRHSVSLLYSREIHECNSPHTSARWTPIHWVLSTGKCLTKVQCSPKRVQQHSGDVDSLLPRILLVETMKSPKPRSQGCIYNSPLNEEEGGWMKLGSRMRLRDEWILEIEMSSLPSPAPFLSVPLSGHNNCRPSSR